MYFNFYVDLGCQVYERPYWFYSPKFVYFCQEIGRKN